MLEPIHPVISEGLRRMPPARKFAMVSELYDAGIALRVAGLRLQHPDRPLAELDFEARKALRHAGT
jgi:hypothetical protein